MLVNEFLSILAYKTASVSIYYFITPNGLGSIPHHLSPLLAHSISFILFATLYLVPKFYLHALHNLAYCLFCIANYLFVSCKISFFRVYVKQTLGVRKVISGKIEAERIGFLPLAPLGYQCLILPPPHWKVLQ